jgi:tetratricopeptide (TPR) repeat protein
VFLAKNYLTVGLLDPARTLATQVVTESESGGPYLAAADMLGQIALRDEDNQSALKWYRELTKLRRVSGDYFLVGLCESNAGNPDQAIKAFEQALRIDPTLLLAHQRLALLLEQSGDTARAQKHLDAIRKIRASSHAGHTAPQ